MIFCNNPAFSVFIDPVPGEVFQFALYIVYLQKFCIKSSRIFKYAKACLRICSITGLYL